MNDMTKASTAKPDLVVPSTYAQKVQKVMSPGGIKAWLVEDYAVPLVSFDFSFKGGAAQDPETLPGVAMMLSGLLDEGAGQLDAEAFHAALDDKAISISFDASHDLFSGHVKTLSRHVDAAFELLALAVKDAHLGDEALERVRSQVLAGLKSEVNDPDAMASRGWRAAAFPHHPYGRPVRGTLESLPLIKREDLVAMRARIFARDNLSIGVVGAIDAVKLGILLDQVFGTLPATGGLAVIPDVTIAGVGTHTILDVDVPQTTIRFGRAGIGRHDPDFIPGFVVNHILGGGVFTARLFTEVREKRGLAYSVHSQMATYDHCALLMGSTSTKNERAAESLSVIAEQIRLLGAEGPTAEELDKAQKYLIGSYALRFDTSTKISRQLVGLQTEGFDVDYLDQRNGLMAAVTLDDTKRVAKRLFGDGELLVTYAGRPVDVA